MSKITQKSKGTANSLFEIIYAGIQSIFLYHRNYSNFLNYLRFKDISDEKFWQTNIGFFLSEKQI